MQPTLTSFLLIYSALGVSIAAIMTGYIWYSGDDTRVGDLPYVGLIILAWPLCGLIGLWYAYDECSNKVLIKGRHQ